MTDFENEQGAAVRDAGAQVDEPMISIRDFNLWYGDFQALKGVTLDIPKNRATAFIGPSGCGKSTLLRTFNRMCDFVPTVRTEGVIEVAGRDIFSGDANELRVRVGMVFQHPNPFPMSIRDNILYGPRRMRRLGRAEADELVERCLRDAGLWDEVRDKLGQSGLGLSGGQQQRLCIARALATQPEVLLMDEPTSALDPELTKDVLKVIRDLAAERMTMVIVTHEMSFARDVADHIVFMDGGVIVEEGPAEQVINSPRHQRTRAFLAKYEGE